MAHGLSIREHRFCGFILDGKDATTAHRRAGYEGENHGQLGYQLLQKTSIQTYLARKRAEIEDRGVLRKEDLERDLAAVINSDIADFPSDITPEKLAELPSSKTRAVKKLKTRIVTTREGLTETSHELELHGKDAARTQAMRMLGLDKQEIALTGDAIFMIKGLED